MPFRGLTTSSLATPTDGERFVTGRPVAFRLLSIPIEGFAHTKGSAMAPSKQAMKAVFRTDWEDDDFEDDELVETTTESYAVRQLKKFEAVAEKEEAHRRASIEREMANLQKALAEMEEVEDPFPNNTIVLRQKAHSGGYAGLTITKALFKSAEGVWMLTDGQVTRWKKVVRLLREPGYTIMHVTSYDVLPEGGSFDHVGKQVAARKTTAKRKPTTARDRRQATNDAEAKKERYARAAATRKANREAKVAATTS